ncbi:hypothetical protein [Candidatus Endoriftia persephonae]|jgi:hypothetical protein|uniref:Uncharacterized protein n=2 Tax=Gammaproteobacteria TaxID=1236 RepID=G2FE31_9GAMM|nr:hypothetical protein [Candidatus Endoriftia persephone]EGW55015.1 hypothetical protein TevJSym_ag00930 [endosymbiont of Tevnia jerichonana (vent Tica)]USF87833.1 hypothetical protein L0Y14_00875 [Candidatus Endoriftia persephone]
MDHKQQILAMHARFINEVVKCSQNPERQAELEQHLKQAEENGWTALVSAVRQMLKGRRDAELLNSLDEEDQTIAESILLGMQNPATLPDPDAKPDPAMAAPGLASMIHTAASGNPQALQLISEMAEQMSKAGGPLAGLASVIRPMINGEREPERLCKHLDDTTGQLVQGILKELNTLEQQ